MSIKVRRGRLEEKKTGEGVALERRERGEREKEEKLGREKRKMGNR